ncbi:MAG TPA: hypothetical protein VFG42_17130 [Baekduia sp.]|uniref:hypothetical protein n=1 Tax=Baekduia sp. TaxID=2600305 RepID=UPI002D77FDC2|nr:hypothetical protein [Baekduia sp.]HET6508519.1 hypothetical protein [Baekduia sp.]
MPRTSGALLRCLLAAALCVAAALTPAGIASAALTTSFTSDFAALTSGPPVSLAAPVISGEAVRGTTLIVNSGSWSPSATAVAYQWQRDDGTGFVDIGGATATSYTLTPADEGNTIRVHVLASNASGSGAIDTSAIGPVIPATPVNTIAPTVSGSAVGGNVLSATRGAWSPAGTSYSFRWQRDDGSGYADISGATSSSYTTVPADVGATLRAQVTATNPYDATTIATAGVGPISSGKPVNASAPSVSGTPKRGAALAVTPGSWKPSATSYTFQWQRDNGSGFADIAGANGTSYVATGGDIGAALQVVVTATNAFGTTTATSAATANVAADPPVNLGSPGIAGTAKRTFTLTASGGLWSPAGSSLTYQWQRDDGSGWADIGGATAMTYTMVAGDVGTILRVAVKATNVDGYATAYSAPTATVAAATPASQTAPVVTGKARVGETLTTTTGSWNPAASSYAYQWQRKVAGVFTDISGANAQSYALTAADEGAQVRAKVTATNTDGDGDGYSAATVAVVAPPVAPTTIDAPSGTLEDTNVLTIDGGTWTPASTTLTYQWLRCPAGATTIGGCSTIGTGKTHTLAGADVGHTIAVRVTGTIPGASTVVTSDLTADIQGRALINRLPPTIGGLVQVAQTLRATAGVWSVPTNSERFQWRRCDPDGSNCTDIPGATRPDYKVVVADKDRAIVLREYATSWGQAATADSAAAVVADQPLPSIVAAPLVTGTAARTQNLQVSRGVWQNDPTSFAYQWQRCDADGVSNCADILNATRANYVLTAVDTGHTIVAAVTAGNTEGTTTVTSAPTAVVAKVLPELVTLGDIIGTLQVPQTLQVRRGVWRTTQDTNYAYQWQRCDPDGTNCVDIAGARVQSYRLQPADARARMRVVQSATNPDGSISVATPVTVPIVPAKPGLMVSPRLTGVGRADVGKTITLTPGSWNGSTEITSKVLEFWRCNPRCTSLTTGGAGSYVLTDADAGALIRGSETATGPGGTTVAWASAWLGPVHSATAATSSFAARGGTATLRTSSGVALASATVGSSTGGVARAAAAAARDRTVKITLTRAKRAPKGKLRAWACLAKPAAEETAPCTKAVSLGPRRTTLKLKVAKGAAVRVTVVRSRPAAKKPRR